MADASLVVRVRSVGERKLKEIRRDLDRISVSATAASASLKAFGKSYTTEMNKRLDAMSKGYKRHFDELDSMIKMTGRLLSKGLGLAIKAATAEFGLMGLSMITVHGLFAAGNLLSKAYAATMKVLAGAAATAAVALASVAAAMRENNAAMFAYKADGSYRQFGNNLNQVRVVMRGMERDTRLATLTVENLNAAYAAVSSRSTFTRGSQTLLRGLMDFASAGQPLDQGVKAAGDLIGVLQDPKASFGEISKAAEALGPSMKKAMEEAKKEGINTAEELRRAINDGTLAAMGGVEGQFDAVNSTLMSVMRSGFNQIRSMFADLGQPFLKPLKEATDEIINIFRRTFMRTYGSLQKFGTGTFIDGLVGAVEKLNDLFVHLIRDWLPELAGMTGRIRDMWEDFTRGWNRFKEGLRPLVEGSRILLEFLGKIFGPVWDRIVEKFGSFNKELKDNKANLMDFGSALGEMLVSFSRITDTIRDLFFKSLPFLTKLVNGIRQVAELLGGVLENLGNLFGGAGGGFGAFGLLMGIGVVGRQMQQTKGGFVQRSVGNMNVNAGTVVVTGATAGGQMYPGAAGAQGMTGNPNGYIRRSGGGMSSQRQIVNAANMAANQGAPLTAAQARQMGLSSSQMTQANTRAARKSGGQFRNGAQMPSALQRYSATGRFGPRRLRDNNIYRRGMQMNRSGTARMGSMAALGMASQFMPEETQGAMALGSAVGAFNPLLGLGVAGLGTAMTSQNAAIGIGGGAIGGAAMGFQVAGPAGALAGALAGAAIGGIKAGFNANEARKDEARAVARNVTDQMMEGLFEGIKESARNGEIAKFTTDSIDELFQMNTFQQLALDTVAYQKDEGSRTHQERQELVRKLFRNREIMGFQMTAEEFAQAIEKPHEFLETLEEGLGPTFDAMVEVSDKYKGRMELLADAFNMTEEEVLRLAQSTGTNLFDAMQGTGEMIDSLAEGLITTKADYDNAVADAAAGAFDTLRTIREREEAPAVVNEAAQSLLDLNREGALTGADVAQGYEDIFNGLIAFYEGDVGLAAAQFMDQFGQAGTAFKSGNLLGGLDAAGEGLLKSVGAEFIPAMLSGIADSALQGVNTRLAQNGFQTDLTSGDLQGVMASNPAMYSRFIESLFGLSDEQIQGGALAELMDTTFPGLDFQISQLADTSATQATNIENSSETFIAALEEMISAMDLAISELGGDSGDTRTPRGDTLSSRFSRTMTAHGQLDSMLSGKRTITSGWRNFNLGSPSSDHVMGRAYDLTGQNLGQYKSLVDASGGFAEFHGSGGSRHLHVVPNTSGAIGDASSPVGSMSTGSAGSTSYNNYTINVNGADHSPQEIADMVMVELDRLAISDGERR
jgi:hypothetical protein